jgi:hypothetical protein
MVLELSNIIFTDQDDSVPSSGMEEIFNTGIANTLAGNDVITGTGNYGLGNSGTFNTNDGNDTITGTGFTTGITLNFPSTVDTGKGNDVITGTASIYYGIINLGTFNTDDGNDLITGTAGLYGIIIGSEATLDTGKGNDIITGTAIGGIANSGTINTGYNEDSIISQGYFSNYGGVFLGDGNDSINVSYGDTEFRNNIISNYNAIETGNGDDTITSNGVIYNTGVINTGNGDDSIIVGGGINNLTDTSYGIYNNGGAINMGDGNDSIISNKGFESGPNSSGAWFLGEGDDYIKGFGSGDFYGGNGNDTLELTPGTYTVGIWGEGGESPIFTKGNQLMITSEFEKLKAGSTIYGFSSLTAGQIIIVS